MVLSLNSVNVPASAEQRWAKSLSRTYNKKVYGKHKSNATWAVLGQDSPTTPEKAVTSGLDDIRAKLANIRIQDDAGLAGRSGSSSDDILQVTAKDSPDKIGPGVKGRKLRIDMEQREEMPKCRRDLHVKAEIRNGRGDQIAVPTKSKPKASEKILEVRIPLRRNMISKGRNDKRTMNTEAESTIQKAPVRVSSGFISDEGAVAYVQPILNEAISPFAAQGIQKFSSWAARGRDVFEVVKLAEGSYGEVYKLRLRDALKHKMSKPKFARFKACDHGVLKIVPLRSQRGAGSRKFTRVDEIVSETKMLKYLDPIPGFARFRDIHVVHGRFPKSFQAAWDSYKQARDDCLNPNPSSKSAYPDSQMWAIVEMDDAGYELEKFPWSSIFQIYDIFWGVAMALARAEEYAMFEHRDLHLGNICIRTTRPNGCLDPPSDCEIPREPTSGFGLSTLETTIIDYSLSRAEMQTGGLNGPLEAVSSNLDRRRLFDAIGQDEDEALLRDTYRYMRAEVYTGVPTTTDKTPDIDGIWAEYVPRTNLIWLLFLLKNLLKNRKDQPQRHPLAACTPNQNLRKNRTGPRGKSEAELAKQISPTETLDHVPRLKKTLEERLKTVLGLLDLKHGHEDICCAADLVAFAIDSRWLSEEDFF